MGREVDLSRLLLRDVSVDLRSRRAGMAQQFLHHAKVRASLQHMRREGVPERVGVHSTRQARFNAVATHLLLDAAVAKAASKPV